MPLSERCEEYLFEKKVRKGFKIIKKIFINLSFNFKKTSLNMATSSLTICSIITSALLKLISEDLGSDIKEHSDIGRFKPVLIEQNNKKGH